MIEPGSPWQNPFVESFGSRIRDEVLSVEAFDSVLEAETVITDWRTDAGSEWIDDGSRGSGGS